MRSSAFVVPSEDQPRILAATAQPIERFAWMLRGAGVSPEGFEAARSAVLAAADEPRTTRELRVRAGELLGPDVDAKWLVSYLALRGDLATLGAASLTSNESRYQARTTPLKLPGAGRARAWLAGEYLRAFGPARPADLGWWAGWPAAVATAALADLDVVEVGDGSCCAEETWRGTRPARRWTTSWSWS